MFSVCEPFQDMRISPFAPQRVREWRGLGLFFFEPSEDKSIIVLSTEDTFLSKLSNKGAATALNINNMNMGPILRHAALYPLHPGIKFSPWKCVNFANTSLPTLYYEISGCFRIGQNFHIFAHFHHFATVVKCISGYRLQLLITSLTIF